VTRRSMCCSDSHSAACSREPSPSRVTCVDSQWSRDRAMADEVRTQAFIDAHATRLDKGASGSCHARHAGARGGLRQDDCFVLVASFTDSSANLSQVPCVAGLQLMCRNVPMLFF
jgi:hypothetical protein